MTKLGRKGSDLPRHKLDKLQQRTMDANRQWLASFGTTKEIMAKSGHVKLAAKIARWRSDLQRYKHGKLHSMKIISYPSKKPTNYQRNHDMFASLNSHPQNAPRSFHCAEF